MPPKTLPLKSPIAGVVEQVDADEATARLAEGWTVPTDAEVRESTLQDKYGGLGYGLAAAGMGAVSSASFGATDVLIKQLGLEKQAAELEEAQPEGYTIGEVGGALLGMGKFAAPAKGAGMLARGGKAALRIAGKPGRAVFKAGEAAERLAGSGILGAGLRGGLEGAAYGGRELVHEANIHDQELTPELVASTVGLNTLLGAGMGSALAAGGKAAGWGGKRLQAAMAAEEGVEGVAQSVFGYAAKGLGKMMRSVHTGMGRPGGEFIEEAIVDPAVRKSMVYGRERIASRIDDVYQRQAAFEEKMALGQDRLKGLAKTGEIEHVIDPDFAAQQVGDSERLISYVRNELDEMRNAADYSPTKIYGKKGLESSLEHAEDALATIKKKTGVNPLLVTPASVAKNPELRRDMAKLFDAVDVLKRDSGKITDWYAGKSRLMGPEQRTLGKLKGVYSTLQEGLENRDIWGEAADLQQVVNGKWTPLIQADRQNKYGKWWLEKTDMPGHFEGYAYLPTKEKVESVFRNVTNPSGDKAIQAMRARLENGVAFNEMAAARLKNITPEQRAYLKSTADDAKALLGMLDEVAEDATRLNQYEILSKGSNAAGLMGGLVGYGVGTGNPALAAAGALASPLLNPGRTIRQLAAVDQLVAGAKTKLAGAGAPLKAAAKKARPVVIRSTLATRERSRAERAAVAAQEAAKLDLTSTVAQALEPIAAGNPATVELAARTVARATAYLAAHAPKPRRRANHVGALELPPPDEEIERFERRRRAVNDPEVLLKDLRDGVVSYEAVHAVEHVFPHYYQRVKDQLASDIAGLASDGLMIPYNEARNAAIILGQPVDPLDTPEVAQLIRGTYHEPELEEKPPRERPDTAPDLGDRLKSKDDLENVT